MIPRRFWSGFSFWVALCIVFSLYFLWTHVSDPSNTVAPVGQNNPPPYAAPPPHPPSPEPEPKKEQKPESETKLPEKEPEPEVKHEIDMKGKVMKDGQIFTYKDYSNETKFDPIEDNFPWGNSMHSRNDFPKIPSWNRPPSTHVKQKTPLFIGFTRTVCISIAS